MTELLHILGAALGISIFFFSIGLLLAWAMRDAKLR